jgi:hypothetical protein
MSFNFITKLLRQLQPFVGSNKCKHTHIFKMELKNEHWHILQEDGKYKDMGKHGQLQIWGCYICGKVWAYDSGA